MFNISENTLVKILKFGVYASLLWFFITTSGALYPSHTGKVSFLLGLIEILAVFYVALILKYPKYRPKLDLAVWAVIFFIGSLMLSAFFGVDFWASVFSGLKRMSGIFFMLHIVVFFLILTAIFKSRQDWQKFFAVNVAIGVVHSLFALYQKIDPNFLSSLSKEDSVVRTGALFGNPSLLASYLVFVLFISLYLFLSLENRRAKLLSAGSFFVILAAIFTAGTRGTIIGVFVGFIVFGVIILLFSQNKRIKKIMLIALVALVVMGGVLWANRDSQLLESIPVLKRAVNISWDQFSINPRTMLWQSAWDGFKERPILGFGPGNYNLIFNEYHISKISSAGFEESWPSEPHNIFFEYLATVGVVGVLAFLFFIFTAPYLLFKNFKSKYEDLNIFAVFAALIIAHIVQNLFLFDTVYTHYMFFVVFGFIYYLSDRKSAPPSKDLLSEESKQAIISSILLLAIFLVYMNINNFRGAVYVKNFNLKFLEIPSFYKKDFTLVYSKFYFDDWFTIHSKMEEEEMLQKINKKLEEAVKKQPLDVFSMFYRASVLTELGRSNEMYLREAEDLLKSALAINPTRQQLYLPLARIYILKKDFKTAVEIYEKAIELNPDNLETHWRLGIILYADNQEERAVKELDIAFDRYWPRNAEQISVWGLIYATNKMYDKAIYLYGVAIKLSPQAAKYYQHLATVYKEVGDKEKAVELANKAIELDPTLKAGAEQFIKSLE